MVAHGRLSDSPAASSVGLSNVDIRIANISFTAIRVGIFGDSIDSLVDRIEQEAHVYFLLKKCLMANLRTGRIDFIAQLKELLNTAWRHALKPSTLEVRINAVVNQWLREYSYNISLVVAKFEGLAFSRVLSSYTSVASCSDESMWLELQSLLCHQILTHVTHRSLGKSMPATKIVETLLKSYEPHERSAGLPFIKMVECYCKAKLVQVSPMSMSDALMPKLVERLRLEKGYSEEDSIKKSVHLLQALIALASKKTGTTAAFIDGYIDGFLFPRELILFLRLKEKHRHLFQRVQFDSADITSVHKELVIWDDYCLLLKTSLEAHYLRKSYPCLSSLIRNWVKRDPVEASTLVAYFFSLPWAHTSWDFQFVFFSTTHNVLMEIDPIYYLANDSGLLEIKRDWVEFKKQIHNFDPAAVPELS
jgi:hypothetical protein